MVEGVGRQLAENLGIASSEDANSAGAESFMDQLDSADASDGPHVMPYNPDTAPAEPHVMPYDPATDNVGASNMPYNPADTSVQEPLQMPTRVEPNNGYTPPQVSVAEEIASAAFGGGADDMMAGDLETAKWEEPTQGPAYMPYDPATDSGEVANLPYNPNTDNGGPIFLQNAAAPELAGAAA